MTTHPVLAEALKLHEAGYAAILTRGKRAFQNNWNRERQTPEQLRQAFKPGHNVAVVTGRLSAAKGKALIIVDADVRDPGAKAEAWKALRGIIGDVKPTTRTGGGGAHWWYLMPSDALPAKDKIILAEGPEIEGSTKRTWTIEVLLNGHACTVPPSVHPSGKPYTWTNCDAHVEDAPETLLRAIAAANAPAELQIASVDCWSELQPLVSHDEAAPYPLDALPGGIGAAVREVVGFVQCPVPLAACSALTAVSTVVQGLVDVRRAEKLTGPTSLFVLAIAESGERKSKCDEYFTSCIVEWEAQKAEAAKSELEEHASDIDTWEAKRDGIRAAIRQATAKSPPQSTTELEKERRELEKRKPVPLRIPRLIYKDATSQKLGERLATGWPSGAIISAEAGIVLGGHSMKGDPLDGDVAPVIGR